MHSLHDKAPIAVPEILFIYEDEGLSSHVAAAVDESGVAQLKYLRSSQIATDGKSAARQCGGVLVNLERALEKNYEALNALIGGLTVPILFNDAMVSRHLNGWDRARWARHLTGKLVGEGDYYPRPDAISLDRNRTNASKSPTAGDDMIENMDASVGIDIWILAASIGGPEAVRSFVGVLPANLPVTFVLAQHMGSDFFDSMASQLGNATELEVDCAEPGTILKPGKLTIAPSNKRIRVSDRGVIRVEQRTDGTVYEPCIDSVMEDFSSVFGDRLGVIVFSGMARDGVEGCKFVLQNGGEIWAQDPASCVVSSMVDGALETGKVSFVGTPVKLAENLLQYCKNRLNWKGD